MMRALSMFILGFSISCQNSHESEYWKLHHLNQSLQEASSQKQMEISRLVRGTEYYLLERGQTPSESVILTNIRSLQLRSDSVQHLAMEASIAIIEAIGGYNEEGVLETWNKSLDLEKVVESTTLFNLLDNDVNVISSLIQLSSLALDQQNNLLNKARALAPVDELSKSTEILFASKIITHNKIHNTYSLKSIQYYPADSVSVNGTFIKTPTGKLSLSSQEWEILRSAPLNISYHFPDTVFSFDLRPVVK